MAENKVSHVAGIFLIQADAAFLNGAGLGEGEDRNVTVPKTLRGRIPYVSAQAWKRWLRNTLIEETGWISSDQKAIGWNPKGNVNKIAAELNPVEFVEDDIFGYMRAEAGQRHVENEDEESEEESTTERTKSVIRASPFMASVLVSISSNKRIERDEGFVHITKYDPKKFAEAEIERFLSAVLEILEKQDKKKSVWDRLKTAIDEDTVKKVKDLSDKGDIDELRKILLEKAKERGKEVNFIENPLNPLPYTTKFYSAHLQAIFCLNYGRLGVYWNLGDRIELENAKKLVDEGKIRDITLVEPYKTLTDNGKIGRIYEITEKVKPTKKERASRLFKALSVLRGGAKQAQFGTDVSPKVLILAGLNCGNPIFNNLFKDDDVKEQGPIFKVETFMEIIKDYADRIVTPVFVGIRSGYLKNEDDVKKLTGKYIVTVENGVRKIEKLSNENWNHQNPKEDPNKDKWTIEIKVLTPIEAANSIEDYL